MRLSIYIWIFLLSLSTSTRAALAQIVQDATLPTPSMITQNGDVNIIDGGTRAGGNLFHSFKEFSFTSGTAYFNNTLDVQNIISRVTGRATSSIDGLIRANGAANLFLINPNGIIFGQNARLDIGGSFLASTANSVKFANGFEFSATNPQLTPVLTINIPVGLQFGKNPGTIAVQGGGHQVIGPAFSPIILSKNSVGLQVKPGKTLAIIGGDVFFESGTIEAKGGRIELGGVSSDSLVSIDPTASGWELSYEGVPSFQDVRLRGRSLADVSGTGSGSVQIQGRRVTLTDGSVILNQNQGLLPAGSIKLNASEVVEIASGTDSTARVASGLRNETLGLGQAGDTLISTRRLILRDGGQINSLTFSTATGGNTIVNASDSVQLIGVSPLNSGVFSIISSATFNSGDSGNIILSTQQLIVTGGGAIGSSTFGSGQGGNVTINAPDVIVDGYAPITFQPSVLSATSLNTGNAGNLVINTSSLSVQNGGRIDSSASASGDGGRIVINASKSINVQANPDSVNPSLIISAANIESPIIRNLFRLPPTPSGKSGDININTPVLNITGNALITTRNQGPGNGGTIQITADKINITNNGGITATTAIGEGGNIAIQTKLLQLSNGTISATAGQQGSSGNGGNITINADTIAGFKNSSITANAFLGRGGNIVINTQGLFLSPNSIITASSQRGISGMVEVNASRTQPEPAKNQTVSVAQTPNVASVCQGRSGGSTQNRFVITGKGGIPASPLDPVNASPAWRGDSTLAQTVNNYSEIKSSDIKIVPAAQSWHFNADGTVTLMAEPSATSVNTALSNPSCRNKT